MCAEWDSLLSSVRHSPLFQSYFIRRLLIITLDNVGLDCSDRNLLFKVNPLKTSHSLVQVMAQPGQAAPGMRQMYPPPPGMMNSQGRGASFASLCVWVRLRESNTIVRLFSARSADVRSSVADAASPDDTAAATTAATVSVLVSAFEYRS